MAQSSGPGWPALGPASSGSWRGPGAEPPEPPEPTPWHARRTLWLVIAICTAVGYLAVGALATGRVYWEFHRKPTAGELYRAATAEVRDRWRTWAAERIFPTSVPYTSEQGGVEQAQRVGIASGTGCADGVEAASAAILKRHGCRALLRATYVDQLQGIVMTVGVAAVTDERTALAAKDALMPPAPTEVAGTLRALAFPQTVAGRFDDAARQYASAGQAGPYVVLTVAGQTDGRPAAAVRKKHTSALLLAAEVGGNIADALALRAQPDCSQKRQWKC
ncbi:hypothetical protein [Actinomadura sp. DC4]|uniref:hypothetical protein n=1 Tax=Actinomadura sp. DC4 TaxID=3055069 RepID=UPI0025AF5B87|nr:hypothetical protein [Actinomadura sp. DC4]MDN3352734.1 hypothetical protein [Actinomadura sp. DC4]